MGDLQSWLNTLGPYAAMVPSIITLFMVLRQSYTIKLLEVNTNSIKDALVAATAKASHLEGRAEQQAEINAEAKSLVAAGPIAVTIEQDENNPVPVKPVADGKTP